MSINTNGWKAIDGWDNYLISPKGDVFSIRRNKLMSIYTPPNNYARVTLSRNAKDKSFCIHKLVALAYLPNPENKITVNHKDGNKANNCVENLEWATLCENMSHAFQTGLLIPHDFGKGENHDYAKLNNVDIAMIRWLLKGDFTDTQIAKRFNVHQTHITSIKLGKTRTQTELNVQL